MNLPDQRSSRQANVVCLYTFCYLQILFLFVKELEAKVANCCGQVDIIKITLVEIMKNLSALHTTTPVPTTPTTTPTTTPSGRK